MEPRPEHVETGLEGRERGFSLIEVVVTLAVTVILLVGILAIFDFNSRVARVQTHVADMQQSLRIAQHDMLRIVRMAGRGGIPAADPLPLAEPRFLPEGIAVAVRDDVADDELMLAGNDSTKILPGTDVLIVRGVFTTPLYQINYTDPANFIREAPATPGDPPPGGRLTIVGKSPTGVDQTLEPLKQAITAVKDGDPEALLLVSPLSDAIYAVVELLPASTVDNPNQVTLHFKVTGSEVADAMLLLGPASTFPAALENVAYAGLLEEYRFYVREERAVAGDPASELMPKLSRARFLPGTEVPYRGAGNAAVDIADNVVDLQVALGLDADRNGAIAVDPTGAPTEADEWLFNSPDDRPDDVRWRTNPAPPLSYLRITTLARTDRRDPDYQSPPLTALENHDYTGHPENSRESRMFRRRALETVVDLRNL